MPIYQGDKKIVGRYVGETLIIKAYQGDKLIFDAYSELSGTLPLYVRSRASQVLKNYIIYGTSEGVGVETENKANPNNVELITINNKYGVKITGAGTWKVKAFDNVYSYIYARVYNSNNEWVGDSVTIVGSTNIMYSRTITLNDGDTLCIFDPLSTSTEQDAKNKIREDKIVAIKSDTAPSSYIPHGYKLPITVTSNGTTTDYPVYIGDSKLGEEEYVDYESGKAYKRTEIKGLSEPLCGINDYKDTLDLSTGTLTRRVNKLVLTGDESYWSATYWAAAFVLHNTISTTRPQPVSDIGICSHFKQRNGQILSSGEFNVQFTSANNRIVIGFGKSGFETMDDFKSYLATQYAAGTPVTVWYILNTPTVETITVPSGLTGTIEGYLVQDETPTPTDPIYPTSNGTKQQDNTYSVYADITPTDPPIPLPDITLPQGEVTIDTEEEFKYNSTVKGRINPVHYAYRINPDTAEITYLADNKNFTPAAMGSTTFDYGSWKNAFFMPRPCMLKSDGTVDYYLDPNDYSKKLDGTASDIADPTYDGNVMLEFPKIWYKFVPTGDDGEGGTFHCSNVKLDDDYECWCNYDANNNEIDHFYVAAYNGIILDGKMRSLSGYALTQENGADTTTGPQEIAAARANNQNGIDEWYTYLLADHQLLTYLATLMCKHVNHQAKFGRGIDSGSTAAKRAYVTGTLNDKGLFWGDTSTGAQAVKIFGIENFYACVWKRIAGLIGTSTGYAYKLTHGTKDGSTSTSFNTNGSGYKTIARTKPANGWVTTMQYEPNGFWTPATTGTNRYGDYYYNGNGYALIGGGSYNGSACGSWCVYLYGGVSYSYWSFSSALSCKPRALASGT